MSENKLSFPVPAALLPRQPVHCAEFPASTVLRGLRPSPGLHPVPQGLARARPPPPVLA